MNQNLKSGTHQSPCSWVLWGSVCIFTSTPSSSLDRSQLEWGSVLCYKDVFPVHPLSPCGYNHTTWTEGTGLRWSLNNLCRITQLTRRLTWPHTSVLVCAFKTPWKQASLPWAVRRQAHFLGLLQLHFWVHSLLSALYVLMFQLIGNYLFLVLNLTGDGEKHITNVREQQILPSIKSILSVNNTWSKMSSERFLWTAGRRPSVICEL